MGVRITVLNASILIRVYLWVGVYDLEFIKQSLSLTVDNGTTVVE